MLNNCINERFVLYLRGILFNLAVLVVKTLMSHRSFGISAEKIVGYYTKIYENKIPIYNLT
jgi:hypothetical protein